MLSSRVHYKARAKLTKATSRQLRAKTYAETYMWGAVPTSSTSIAQAGVSARKFRGGGDDWSVLKLYCGLECADQQTHQTRIK